MSEHTKGSVINLAAIRAQREKAATDRHIAILDATAAYFRERNRLFPPQPDSALTPAEHLQILRETAAHLRERKRLLQERHRCEVVPLKWPPYPKPSAPPRPRPPKEPKPRPAPPAE